MSWSGNFKIKYYGDNPKNFHKLAKMIIPNSIVRFDFDNSNITNNSVDLLCTRNLSWYSANEDMKKLLSYMPDGEAISMEIDGEGEQEKILIPKQNGMVGFLNSNPESERWVTKDIGIPEMLYAELSDEYADEPDRIDICSLDGYMQFIANIFADDYALMPMVQDFMYTILDKDLINKSASNGYGLSKEVCDKLDKLREKFLTVESTIQFLKEYKNDEITYESNKKQDINDLPEWAKKYPESVINALGGANLIKELIETRGVEVAKKTVEFLGDGILEERKQKQSEEENSYSGFKR